MKIETIASLLMQYGWSFDRVGDDTLAAAFENEGQSFLMVFQLDHPWLRMYVPAYLPVPVGEESKHILQRALMLNQRTRMARFALDERGHLILCLDMYAASEIAFADFEVAIEALCYAAGALYQRMASPESGEQGNEG